MKAGRFEVAVIATHVKPAKGYGGVAESAYNLCAAWSRAGHSVFLCASDGSEDGRIRVSDIDLPNVVIALYHASLFRRWGFGWGAPLAIFRACLRADSVYICGIATWPTTLAALFCLLLRRPFAISTRGGLMARLVALAKREKPLKWLYYRFLTLPSCRRAGFLHVTSALERDAVAALLPDTPWRIVANGIALEAPAALSVFRQGSARLCYVGRLSREKGILRFAELWSRARRPGDSLTILGSGPADYQSKLESLAGQSDGAIVMTGYRPRQEVAAALAQCDFLVLPSGMEEDDVRENFGNSVAEALALGRPVLVTRGLAWDDIEAAGIGYNFNADGGDLPRILGRIANLTPEEHCAMGERAHRYARERLDLAATAAELWSAMADLTGKKR